MSKAEVCASSNISTFQALLMNSGATGRRMPNVIDGLPALMTTF